jgi:hypothetical protein
MASMQACNEAETESATTDRRQPRSVKCVHMFVFDWIVGGKGLSGHTGVDGGGGLVQPDSSFMVKKSGGRTSEGPPKVVDAEI